MPVIRLRCFWSCKASATTTLSPWPIPEPANTGAKNRAAKESFFLTFPLEDERERAGARVRRSLPSPAQKTPSAQVSRGSHQLVRGEAVEQAVAAGAPQVVLAAAAVGPARGMRRIPRLRRGIVAQTLAVAVADHRGALGAARPVAAGSEIGRAACRERVELVDAVG